MEFGGWRVSADGKVVDENFEDNLELKKMLEKYVEEFAAAYLQKAKRQLEQVGKYKEFLESIPGTTE